MLFSSNANRQVAPFSTKAQPKKRGLIQTSIATTHWLICLCISLENEYDHCIVRPNVNTNLISVVCSTAVYISLAISTCAQSSFQNLSFESARLFFDPSVQVGYNPVNATNAFRGWTIYGGYTYPDVLYNNEALDSASISLLSTNYTAGIPGFASGAFYVKLRGASFDPTQIPAIGQTAQIPISAVSLTLIAYNAPVVTFQGNTIPLMNLGSAGAYSTIYGGDISAFAGQVGELRLSSRFSYFDNIQFSTQPIPELTALGLAVYGSLLFSFRRWRKGCAVQSNSLARNL